MDFDTALIIDEPWIGKILSGEKTVEMRTRKTNIRGRIGLIKKGSGLIVGAADLTFSDSVFGSKQQLIDSEHLHCIPYGDDWEKYKKWRCPWCLENVEKFDEPIQYKHPQGAVVWVKV